MEISWTDSNYNKKSPNKENASSNESSIAPKQPYSYDWNDDEKNVAYLYWKEMSKVNQSIYLSTIQRLLY